MTPHEQAEYDARVLARLRSEPVEHHRTVSSASDPKIWNVTDRRNSPYPYAVGVELLSGHPLWAFITGLFWWFRGRR